VAPDENPREVLATQLPKLVHQGVSLDGQSQLDIYANENSSAAFRVGIATEESSENGPETSAVVGYGRAIVTNSRPLALRSVRLQSVAFRSPRRRLNAAAQHHRDSRCILLPSDLLLVLGFGRFFFFYPFIPIASSLLQVSIRALEIKIAARITATDQRTSPPLLAFSEVFDIHLKHDKSSPCPRIPLCLSTSRAASGQKEEENEMQISTSLVCP